MQLVPDELLHQIVARTLAHGGATFDLATLAFESPGDFWYFPRYPSRTRIVDQRRLPEEIPAFIERNREVCTGADLWLGTWINPQSGQCYLDLTMRLAGKDQALREARRVSEADGRKIVTMYTPGSSGPSTCGRESGSDGFARTPYQRLLNVKSPTAQSILIHRLEF